MKKLVILCAFVLSCAFLLPGHALATPFTDGQIVNLTYKKVLSPSTNVNMTFPNYPGGIGVVAGVYEIDINHELYKSFCVEDVPNTTLTKNYQLLALSNSANSLSIGYTYAAWLADNYYGGIGWSAAATQVAIWEASIETSITNPYNLADGNVQTKSSIADVAISALNAQIGGFYFDTTGWFVARSCAETNFQDFLVKLPVPEPATMLLLGFGLVGLAVVGRRNFIKK